MDRLNKMRTKLVFSKVKFLGDFSKIFLMKWWRSKSV